MKVAPKDLGSKSSMRPQGLLAYRGWARFRIRGGASSSDHGAVTIVFLKQNPDCVSFSSFL